MDALIASYKSKIEVEREKIKKLKLEIENFEERKNKEILASKNKILAYEQHILKHQSTI